MKKTFFSFQKFKRGIPFVKKELYIVNTNCLSYNLYKIYLLKSFTTYYELNKQNIEGFSYQTIPERIRFNQVIFNRFLLSSLYQLLLVGIKVQDIINSLISKNQHERFFN